MEKIIQNYKIISQIAEGGMGTVFYGEHKTLNRPVAIKQLHSNFTNNVDFKNRFVNEAVILAQLNHSNIITIYDLIEEYGNFYIVMEYIQGDTIDEIMNKYRSPFQPQRAMYIFKQILSAFDYAHRKGVIHRDIKPSNIILEEGDKPKILDFGIAKLVSSNLHLTKAGTKMGSVLYMSPEQVLGHDVDHRSDIYSLGILLYEMLTMSLPYDIQTDSEYTVMEEIMKKEIPDLSLIRNDISRNTALIIQKACAKDKFMRFESCEEFLNSFEQSNTINYNPPFQKTSIVSNPVSASPSITSYKAGDVKDYKKSNNKAALWYAAIPLLLVGVILILYFIMQGNEDSVTVKTTNKTESTTSPNTTSTSPVQKQNTSVNTNSESDAVKLVRSFIEDLGNRDFKSAYSKQNNKNWGSYEKFSSTSSYGGITSTEIKEIRANYEYGSEAEIYVYYYSYDPSNKDGWYKQTFTVKKFGDNWKIVKSKVIDKQLW